VSSGSVAVVFPFPFLRWWVGSFLFSLLFVFLLLWATAWLGLVAGLWFVSGSLVTVLSAFYLLPQVATKTAGRIVASSGCILDVYIHRLSVLSRFRHRPEDSWKSLCGQLSGRLVYTVMTL
jgi:hypothetical protein